MKLPCDYCCGRGTLTVFASGPFGRDREEVCDHCGGTQWEPDPACQKCLDGEVHDHRYEPAVGRASVLIAPGRRAVSA